MSIAAFVFSVIPNAIGCFWGLKLQKIVLCLVWFILGFGLMGFIFEQVTLDNNLALIIQVVVGIILGIFSLKLQKLSFFIVLFVLGFFIIYSLTSHIWYNYLIGVVVGLILGGIAVKIYEPMIIVTTAITGGYGVGYSIYKYFKLDNIVYFVLMVLVIMVLGLTYQITSYKKKKN